MKLSGYRYPNEELILGITLVVLLGISIFAAGVSFCLLPLLVFGFTVLVFLLNKQHHNELLQQATRITSDQAPGLWPLIKECEARLGPGPVDYFVVPNRERNAYTFGFSDPKIVVIYSSMLNVMDADELKFIIGHELGHVVLGHTWLNTLLGGMSGIPTSLGAAILLTFSFRWWNRACEYSADRAGMLACGSLNKATSALVKLVAGKARTQAEFDRALNLIDQEDDSLENVLAETLSTHPLIIRRINQLREYAATPECQRLMAQR